MLKCSTFSWRQSFSVGFNCSEEGRPSSVTEKSQSASSSPQGPRRSWASPSHSIHGSEPHRKHSELPRRTSTASGTKTQDRIHNCLFSAVHSYRLGFYFLFCFLHCICSSIEENAKKYKKFGDKTIVLYSSKHALARVRKASPISGLFDWWLVTAAWFLQGLSLKITVIRRLDSDLMWSIPLSGGPLDICYK